MVLKGSSKKSKRQKIICENATPTYGVIMEIIVPMPVFAVAGVTGKE